MADSTSAPIPSPQACCLFPVLVLLIGAILFAVPWVWVAIENYGSQLGIPEMEPSLADGAMPFFMFTQWIVPMLTAALIALWWLFFSGIAWSVRLLGVVLVGGLAVGFRLSVQKFELTMSRVGLVPRIEFVWDATPTFDASIATDGLPPIDATISDRDFPSYRGVKTDGIVSLAGFQTDWSNTRPERVWSKSCLGGYGGVAVAGNIVVTILQHEAMQKEVIVCYDRATGRQRWTFAYSAYHKDIMGDGPRATPTIRDNRIYSLGGMGDLVCLGATGNKLWAANILKDSGAEKLKWGMTSSPLVVDGLVIVNSGVDPANSIGPSLLAYDAVDGKIRWQTGKRKAGYSSAQLSTIAGVVQVLLFDGEGLVAYEPKTGKELWQHPWVTPYEMNSIQPVVLSDDRVYISSELTNGCAMLKIKRSDNAEWSTEVFWQHKRFASRYANVVTDGKRLFGLHNLNGVLTCLDANDGSVLWKANRQGPGQLLLVNDTLLVVNGETGEVSLFNTDGAELGQHRAFIEAYKTWNTPAIAGDQLFLRNQREIVCVKLPTR
ncbi:MAG: hypothetical protein EXS16_04980 [Gemmataceae bacterium]|nr:hypothetical protein [Gemmataceae bacterium]